MASLPLTLGTDYRIEVAETASGEIEFSGRFLVPAAHQAKRREVLRDWYIAQSKRKDSRSRRAARPRARSQSS